MNAIASRRGVLLGLAALPVPSVVAEGASDAALIAAGRELAVLWTAEREIIARCGLEAPETFAAEELCNPVIRRIQEARATSLAGLVVKAQACSYCQYGEPFTSETFADGAPDAIGRITGTLVRDLLAMGGLDMRGEA